VAAKISMGVVVKRKSLAPLQKSNPDHSLHSQAIDRNMLVGPNP
jgi:hypothetical protein